MPMNAHILIKNTLLEYSLRIKFELEVTFMEDFISTDANSKQLALGQIIQTANNLNDPIEFTSQVAEILQENRLIPQAVYEILTGHV